MTIASVSPKPRYWEQGQTYFVQGAFGDGSEWSLGFKAEDRATAAIETFKGFIGQEQEYDLESKPSRNERPQWKLKGWPGKPERPAFGGGGRQGGSYQPRYRDTEQGAHEERLAIARSVALQQAVASLPELRQLIPEKQSADEVARQVVNTADRYYLWLIGEMRVPQPRPSASLEKQEAYKEQEALPPSPQEPAKTRFPKPPCPKCGSETSVFTQKDKATGKYKDGSYYCWKAKGGCGHEWAEMEEMGAAVGATPSAPSAFQKYKVEINKALIAKDSTRLNKLQEMVVQSFDGGSVTMLEADELDKDLQAAKKILSSGENHAKWVAEQQEKAMRRDPGTAWMPPEQEVPF